MIDETFLDNLPENTILAANEICDRFIAFQEEDNPNGVNAFNSLASMSTEPKNHDMYVVALGGFDAFCEANELHFDYPELESNKRKNITSISNFFQNTKIQLTQDVANLALQQAKEKFTLKLGKTFFYEFSGGDIDKIQELITQLRSEIVKAPFIEETHKERLLKRLEKTQQELNKRVSDLDRFWGLIGDAGVVLGKFGEDSKPLVDRIKDITSIVWRTQARAEELPSDSPLPLLNTNNYKNKSNN